MLDMKRRRKNRLYSSDLTRLMLPILFFTCVAVLTYYYGFQRIATALRTNIEHPPNDNARLIYMGITSDCDDGKTNLTVDWDHSPAVYTCSESTIIPDPDLVPEYKCETIPKNFTAEQICMSETIAYSDPIPTYGKRRPAWPVYGEYKYLPVQRWLRSLEHGAIVALYHPCTDPFEIVILKKVVKKCLRRHIISPSNLLDKQKPIALLSWGCKLTMSYVIEGILEQFIQRHALRGLEEFAFHGDFNDQLIEKSQLVSDYDDVHLCPSGSFDNIREPQEHDISSNRV